jgi:hypothetical protein
MSADTLKPILSSSSWADMSEDEPTMPSKAVPKQSFAAIASKQPAESPSGSPNNRNNTTPKHSPIHPVKQRVAWYANNDENTETKVACPELFDRCVFIVGMQGFNESKMIELLKTKNINVLDLVRMRNHHTKKVKDAFAFAVLSSKEECANLISNKVTFINPHLNPPEQVSFRCVQAWDARDYQDPYTIIVKGISLDIKLIRSTFSVLGEPQSIILEHERAYIEYDNTLAPYLAVEMFDNRKLTAKYLQVELAKK